MPKTLQETTSRFTRNHRQRTRLWYMCMYCGKCTALFCLQSVWRGSLVRSSLLESGAPWRPSSCLEASRYAIHAVLHAYLHPCHVNHVARPYPLVCDGCLEPVPPPTRPHCHSQSYPPRPWRKVCRHTLTGSKRSSKHSGSRRTSCIGSWRRSGGVIPLHKCKPGHGACLSTCPHAVAR